MAARYSLSMRQVVYHNVGWSYSSACRLRRGCHWSSGTLLHLDMYISSCYELHCMRLTQARQSCVSRKLHSFCVSARALLGVAACAATMEHGAGCTSRLPSDTSMQPRCTARHAHKFPGCFGVQIACKRHGKLRSQIGSSGRRMECKGHCV